MYICICQQVSEAQIKQAIQQGLVTNLEDLKKHFAIGLTCGQCQQDARAIIDTELKCISPYQHTSSS